MARSKKRGRSERHRQGLPEELEDPQSRGVRTQTRSKRQKEDDSEPQELDEKTTAKVIDEARKQQEELDTEGNALLASTKRAALPLIGELSESESDEEAAASDFGEAASRWDEEVEVSPEDEEAMAAFFNSGGVKQRTLADIILEKIREKEAQKAAGTAPGAVEWSAGHIDEKVKAVYRGVAQIMKRFTTGKVPKAFKIIPSLRNWEEILYLTEPEQWSPHAVYQATRMFVSNLNARLAQRFLALVVLPHVREDIQKNKRLHFALFQAVKKAAFKPDAFYKGILLPLCRSGDCTLREAVILSSAINRVSIPVAHSGAALLRLAEMPYAGTTSFFIRVLLDKKYALPYRVIDALVDHFAGFQRDDRTLPVVWHQSLLVFVQRYKHEIRKEDQGGLRKLLKKQYHYKLSPEIYRELEAARPRGEKPMEDESLTAKAVVNGKGSEDPRSMPPVLLMDED